MPVVLWNRIEMSVLPTTHSLVRSRVVFCSNGEIPVPTSNPNRSLTSSLLRGAALLFGAAAGLSFWIGGRALHEFAKFDRMLGELVGIGLAVVLGVIAVLLKGLAERIEDHDDGQPISLAISTTKESETTDSDN